MTPEDFARAMDEIANNIDPEDSHILADRLLVKVLIEHGYDEGCAIFESMPKWYA